MKTKLALLLVCLASSARAPAQEFLRGDINGDGAATTADAHYLLSWLFRDGPDSECRSASDVDDDGTIDITDAVRLLTSRILLPGPLCAPYPDPGSDPTPDDLGCASYGGGTPLEDASAAIEIEATGTTPGKALITVTIASSRSVGAFEAVVSDEGGVFANGYQAVARDLSGLSSMHGGFVGASVSGGKLRIGFLASFTKGFAIPPVVSRKVLEVEVCLAEGSASGSYSLNVESGELVDAATGRSVPARLEDATLVLAGGVPAGSGCASKMDTPTPPQCGPSQDPGPEPDPDPEPEGSVPFTRGDVNADGRRSISDAVMVERYLFFGDRAPPCFDAADARDDGEINIVDTVTILHHLFDIGLVIPGPSTPVGPDPTPDSLGCAVYDVEPAETTQEVVSLEAVTAAPGAETSIPVRITNTLPIEALQLVIRYDPSVFTPGERIVFDGTFYEGMLEFGGRGGFNIVTANPADGILTVGFVAHLTDSGFAVPPGTDRLVFKIPGTIASDAQPGTEVLLEPTNGPDGSGFGPERLLNELTHTGDARYLSVLPELRGAILGIVGDQTFFVRGDSNQDAGLDISDAVHTLGALFLSGPPLSCRDAADANDDGRMDITDPIFFLNHLFRGGEAPPAPYPSAGEDPTSDDLPCFRGSAAR
jgi:hypothetical protein